jgi:hypothetical protein
MPLNIVSNDPSVKSQKKQEFAIASFFRPKKKKSAFNKWATCCMISCQSALGVDTVLVAVASSEDSSNVSANFHNIFRFGLAYSESQLI